MKADCQAINFKEANDVLRAAPGTEDRVHDLPICRATLAGDPCVVSCWTLPWWKRLKYLFTGRMYLIVQGHAHPPLLLDSDFGVREQNGYLN